VARLPDHLRPVPVGRERLPRDVLEEHQRERVLDAASQVFASRGFAAATVDDLVAAAGIGVGTFYSLFAGKLECFLELYDRTVAAARREISSAAPDPGAPWPQRYQAGLRKVLEMAAADPDRARVTIVEANTAGREGRARHAETLADLAAALAGARASRAADDLPESFERSTAAGLAWLLHQRLAAGGGVRAGELLPEMTRIVLEAYPT
jgi:AcrR family transcriptional regulator